MHEGGVLETPGKERKRAAPLRTIDEDKKNRLNEIIYNACDQLYTEVHDRRSSCAAETGSFLDNPKNIPRQYNSYDCGVFACMYAEAVCQGKEIFDFTQKDMKNCRQKIVDAIMSSAVSVVEVESVTPITIPTATVSGGPRRKEFLLTASASFHQALLNTMQPTEIANIRGMP
ncbi:Protein of unknown function [Cotesia congregata]|uniref:Ubiquitin-like protease family profile domain-containing protein n=1 Tax=Cotesia congregata TaxID=51543 RepID=A0A8J2HHA2_COTCN|nr:Protein of unknown function [Cotesia congregata]